MDTGDLSTLLIFLLLVAASAFFSASETAYTSLNTVRLKRMASDGDKRASDVLALTEKYESLLSTILIGNNIVNILASSLATVTFVRWLGNTGVSVATAVTTVIVLLFGEVAPKSIAKDHAEGIALKFYPVLFAITRLFTPLNWLLGCWQKLMGKVVKPAEDRGFTEEELITIVDEAESEGELDPHESELIRSAIEFTDVGVEEILTPRVEVQAIALDATDEEVAQAFQGGFSRLPVYQESVDNIVGILHEKDFYAHRGVKSISQLMTQPTFVPESMKVSDVLKLLQKSKAHMAVVVDEYDGVTGIVTMEDILEELVGEIWDEHDEVVEDCRPIGDGAYLVSGSANLDDMLELFGIDKEYDPVTVNGWVQAGLGRFPKVGDSFEMDGLKVTVEKAEERRATELRVERTASAEKTES